MIPEAHQIWVHCKGTEYRILCVAEHTEGDGLHVVYQAVTGGQIWVRPLSMFMSNHESGVPRFTLKGA